MPMSPGTSDTLPSLPTYDSSFADHEPGLWRAVITQALMDAASNSRKSEAKRIRHDALEWLLSNTEDFTIVCDNAGLDPDYVRSRARIALARNCQWRLPAGQGWRTRAREEAARAKHRALEQYTFVSPSVEQKSLPACRRAAYHPERRLTGVHYHVPVSYEARIAVGDTLILHRTH